MKTNQNIENLLTDALELHQYINWQTPGLTPEVNIKLIEARADILRSIKKLEQIIELIGT